MEIVTKIAPIALALIMLGLGLGLTIQDFTRVVKTPRDFLVGLISQLIILPIVAFILIKFFGTTPEIALGVMIIAAAPGGITSNILIPGYLNTGLISSLSKEAKSKILKKIPSNKFGDPVNIVNAVEFLIKSDYVNGASINIDGGY